MASLTINSTSKLISGNLIPILGFGVWNSPTNLTTKSCLEALKVGNRHIDTAQAYANEAQVGEAIRTSNVVREELFVTSKIFSAASGAAATYKKCQGSVQKIDGSSGYLDLMLIHTPSPGASGVKMIWQAMEKLQGEGKIKSIGVSNFGIAQIEQMKKYAEKWPPAVNQLEVWTLLVLITAILTDKDVASSVLPTTGDCQILPREQYHS